MDDKLQALLDGACLVVSSYWLDKMQVEHPDESNMIRTAMNRRRLGVKDEYVAWIKDEARPADCEPIPNDPDGRVIASGQHWMEYLHQHGKITTRTTRAVNLDEQQHNADWPKSVSDILASLGAHVIELDVGDRVICDWCAEDYSQRNDTGGIVFGSKACCPECAPGIERDAKADGKTKYIRARCPAGKSFAAWVREDLR